jgi:hypothetical protein
MRLLVTFLLALVLTPAALADGPRAQTIAGTISANSGGSITVTSGDRSITCVVVGARAQSALLRWGVGARAAMACKQSGDHLLLARLSRLGTKEPAHTSTDPVTTRTTDDHGTTAPTPQPTPTPTPPPHPPATTTAGTPPPPPPAPDHRDARGIVTALSTDGVTVKPDAGGDSLRCRITPAPDSTAAAAKLSLGAHVGITCRRDGDSYVLAGATAVS